MFANEISGKAIVIGDTHGDLDATQTLLNYLTKHRLLDGRWVVFIGDYVDVGPDTNTLISHLLDFQEHHPATTFIAGNHDLNLAKALGIVESPHRDYYWRRIPTRNREVLNSYDARDGDELLEKVPAEHKAFLASLPWLVESPDFLFVHCGFDPCEPLDDQIAALRKRDPSIFKPKWLYDDRLAFRDHSHQTGKLVISGHVILKDVCRIGNKVLIDTGAGYGGVLSALLLPEMRYFQTRRRICT